MSNCGCEPKNYIISCCTEPKLGPIEAYYTKFTIDRKLEEITSAITSGCCITPEEVDEKITSAITEIEAEIPSLSGYATEQWVEDKHYITGVDLSNYATLEDIPTVPTNVSAFINDASYVATSELLQHISNLQQQINSLISSISGCCGSSGETQYRWITMTGENDYWCSGTTKMSEEKEQSSTDGLIWTDTGNIRSGDTVLQTDCEDCGYIPSFSGKMYTAITTADTIYYRDCISEEQCEQDPIACHELTPQQIIQRIGLLKEVIIGDCIHVTNSSTFDGEYNLEKLTVPSTFTAFKGIPLKGCTSMKELVINATTPPYIQYGYLFELDPFDVEQIPANFKIYVPSESVNTYKTDTTWSRYENIIQAIV